MTISAILTFKTHDIPSKQSFPIETLRELLSQTLDVERILIACYHCSKIIVIDMNSQRVICTIPSELYTDFYFLNKSEIVISHPVSEWKRRKLDIWNFKDRKCMLSYTPPFIVIDIIFVSQYFVIRNDSCQLCVWNRRTGREQTNETLKPTSNLVRINNFQFATSHNKSQQVIVWNVKRLEQVKTIRTSPSFVDCYAPSTLLFSMNSDVVVMDLHTEKTIQLYKNVRNDIVGVQRINDRLIALTVHLPNENLYEVAMYNLDSKKYLPLFGTKKRCTRIGVWYGRLIFFIAEYTLFIMDVEKMVILATFKGKFQDQVKVCAF